MARLTVRHVRSIPSSIAAYDATFRKRIGASLSTVGARASGYPGDPVKAFNGITSKVVPMTAGKGIIGGFAQAVASILNHVGLESDVTKKPDIGGLIEALQSGTSIIFAADDSVFMGLNLKNLRVTYNYVATGRAYCAALEYRVGGLSGKKVSLLGAGRVGSAAAEYLDGRGAQVFVYDLAHEKTRTLQRRFPSITACATLEDCIARGNYAISTVPVRGLIQAKHVRKGTVFAIPAIPAGLTKAALSKLGAGNLIHDDLALGVAAMAYDLAG